MTRVIKIGGRPQSDPTLGALLAGSWNNGCHGALVLVHGGGDEVSTLQAAIGSTARFVDGRRVTSAQDIDLIRMALSGSANKRLVANLVRNGIDAVGFSGEDASLIAASPIDTERLGYVGVPERVNVRLLHHLLAGGYLPVVSPVSLDATATLGSALNVNADDAAAAIAVALQAQELLLVADVPGVLHDGALLPALTSSEADALLAQGIASGGMRAKLQAAVSALAGGVHRVRISDLAAISDALRGTVLIRGEESRRGGT